MFLYTLSNRVLLLLYIASFILISSSIALEDGCISFYGFENTSDMPESVANFHDGWQLDVRNSSYMSGNQPKSTFWIRQDGPLEVSFRYKISTQEYGRGVFQFLIDENPQELVRRDNWVDFSKTVPEKGNHELKWVVYKGNKPYTVWIDSLCVKKSPCSKVCTPIVQNQKPILSSLMPNMPSPQRKGVTIIWNAIASDYENDTLFYKFLLNGDIKRDWNINNSWVWNTSNSIMGTNRVEVWVRDGKHSGPEGWDAKRLSEFDIETTPLPEINRSPRLTRLASDKMSPQDVGAAIIWTAIASDYENDTLFYRFLLNGEIKRDWSINDFWMWNTSENNIGANRIEVWIRDGKHNDSNRFDDRLFSNFIIRPITHIPQVSLQM